MSTFNECLLLWNSGFISFTKLHQSGYSNQNNNEVTWSWTFLRFIWSSQVMWICFIFAMVSVWGKRRAMRHFRYSFSRSWQFSRPHCWQVAARSRLCFLVSEWKPWKRNDKASHQCGIQDRKVYWRINAYARPHSLSNPCIEISMKWESLLNKEMTARLQQQLQ